MKQLARLFSAFLCIPALAACQSSTPFEYLPALQGDYFKYESAAAGRAFHIYVAYPEEYAKHPEARYPVVYLLDGDSLFPILATEHLFLNYDEGVPRAIVVGIAYGSFDPALNTRSHDFAAGAPAFQRFLKSELLPEIDRRYRTDPDRRILFGQSRGGYMVLYSAFTDPDLFWGRIASNAAFDPGRERFFSRPAASSTRNDLGLVVTSSERDMPNLRSAALEWFKAWDGRTDAPWQIHTVTLAGGTHSADSTNSYRAGMVWLFRPERRSAGADALVDRANRSPAGRHEAGVLQEIRASVRGVP
jgi:hypothetical protein